MFFTQYKIENSSKSKAFNLDTTCCMVSVMRLLYIIDLSEVYAYVHFTNTVFVMFILCSDVNPFEFLLA